MGVWADTEEVEKAKEEGRWEGRERTTTKGRHTGRGDDDNDDYAPPHPELEASAALSNSEPAIPFIFGGKDSMATAVE